MNNDDREKFYHPYKPYKIQLDLMNFLYDALITEDKKISIIESPTGTGKTLSLICAALTYLREIKGHILLESVENGDSSSDSSSGEPDWVNESYMTSLLSDRVDLLRDYETKLDHLRSLEIKTNAEVSALAASNTSKRRKFDNNKPNIEINIDNDDLLLPDDYHSDSDMKDASRDLSSEVNLLLNKIKKKNNNEFHTNDNTIFSMNPVKIFYTSRTHSQLSQFTSQLKLIHPPSSFKKFDILNENIKFLPLASRKQYCINDNINKSSIDSINEACINLINSEKGCPYYDNYKKNSQSLSYFTDTIFSDIHDIEDIYKIGQKQKICPYYSTKASLNNAEIVTLPYQYLLNEQSRNSLNIDINNSIVIIDEAHNLINTINSIHSNEISSNDLQIIKPALTNYIKKFRNRLNPGNRINLLKLLKLINIIIDFLNNNKNTLKIGSIINISDLFNSTTTNADLININKLINYINKSKISFKINTYMNKDIKEEDTNKSSVPIFFKFTNFLKSLSNLSNEGTFYLDENLTIKYMLLEPEFPFKDIVTQSRNIILAGGTMEPINDILNNLLPYINPSDISTFSCNHIIPDNNLNTYIINDLNFSFKFRNDSNLINNKLFNFINKLSLTLPKKSGIVVFFPSYDYLNLIVKNWSNNNLLNKIEKIRPIFYETKNGPDILSSYTDSIINGNAGILLSIIGGKLSEGINFNDNLCRALCIVGLPYPNPFSATSIVINNHLKKKFNDKKKLDSYLSEENDIKCMKIVNQCIGRSIRHINDYSCVYLIDSRYSKFNIKNKLSNWIRRRIQNESEIDKIIDSTNNFFKNR